MAQRALAISHYEMNKVTAYRQSSEPWLYWHSDKKDQGDSGLLGVHAGWEEEGTGTMWRKEEPTT